MTGFGDGTVLGCFVSPLPPSSDRRDTYMTVLVMLLSIRIRNTVEVTVLGLSPLISDYRGWSRTNIVEFFFIVTLELAVRL